MIADLPVWQLVVDEIADDIAARFRQHHDWAQVVLDLQARAAAMSVETDDILVESERMRAGAISAAVFRIIDVDDVENRAWCALHERASLWLRMWAAVEGLHVLGRYDPTVW